MGPSEKTFSVTGGREREGGRKKMIQPGNPLNLSDILKQAFIFHFKRREVSERCGDGSLSPSTRDNRGESPNTAAARRRPKSA